MRGAFPLRYLSLFKAQLPHALTLATLRAQHPPVFTVGKRSTTHNLLTPVAALAALGAEVHHTERGGDATFHGPGQLLLYPVLALRPLGCGARAYVEGLEDVLAAVAARHGVTAKGRLPGAPGVWVDAQRKLAAVGVRISAGVTSHGAALNVSTRLDWFKHIVPCGLTDKARAQTSVTALLRPAAPRMLLYRMVTDLVA